VSWDTVKALIVSWDTVKAASVMGHC